MPDQLLFEVWTALGFRVRVSTSRWQLIANVKHPAMVGRDLEVLETLRSPEEVRRSRSDADVYLFYRRERPNRWLCAVVKWLEGGGFLITSYPTDTIKEGERVWTK